MPHPNSLVAAALHQGRRDGTQVQHANYPEPVDCTIALAVGGATDAMDFTITFKDRDGNTIVGSPIPFEFWLTDSAVGIGLSAETLSGALTATVGTILSALTAKLHAKAMSAVTGIFTGRIVASANPATIYVAVMLPNGRIVMSAISGVNWEGV